MEETNISYVTAPITNKTPRESVNLQTIAKAIKENQYYKKITQEYRNLKQNSNNEKEIRKFKADNFDYVTISGEFSYVKTDNLIKHSGYLCIDIDKVNGENQLKHIKKQLLLDEELDTALLFISPSGNGIKWVTPIEVEDIKQHEEYFYAIGEYLLNEYNIEIDPACKDVSRACFLSHDPEVIFNPDTKPASKNFLETWKPIINEPGKEFDPKGSDGSPWQEYNKAGKLGDLLTKHGYTFVRSDETSDKYLRPNPSGGSEYSIVVYRDTGVGYVHSSECAPLPIGSLTPSKALCLLEHNGDWGSCAKHLKTMGFGSDQTLNIESSKLPSNIYVFWEFKGKNKDIIDIDSAAMVSYLEEVLNIHCVKTWDMNKTELVHKEDYVLNSIHPDEVAIKIRENLEKTLKPYSDTLYNKIFNAVLDYWSIQRQTSLIKFLKKVEPSIIEEDKDTSYLYYLNGYVKVTTEKIEFFPYSRLNNQIWKKDIISREYKGPHSYDNFMFTDFCKKTMGGDEERFNTLKSAYGYLLHNYKDPSIPKAVILIDESISDDLEANQGGTGKTALASALKYMRKMCIVPGKQFDPESKFCFSNVSYGDRLFFIDDLRGNIDFQHFYNVLSNDLKVERKGKDSVILPFKESPKFIMTTNLPIKGHSSSYIRRQFILEVADYFGPEKTIKDEYGINFFDESGGWDDSSQAEEYWAMFDNFMIDCLQYYLKNGIKEKIINYHKKRVITTIGPELFEYLEEHLNIPNDGSEVFYKTSELLHGKPPRDNIRGFRLEYPEYKLSARALPARLEAWCDYKGYKKFGTREDNVRGYKFFKDISSSDSKLEKVSEA